MMSINQQLDKLEQWISDLKSDNASLIKVNELLQKKYEERGDFILSEVKRHIALTTQFEEMIADYKSTINKLKIENQVLASRCL